MSRSLCIIISIVLLIEIIIHCVIISLNTFCLPRLPEFCRPGLLGRPGPDLDPHHDCLWPGHGNILSTQKGEADEARTGMTWAENSKRNRDWKKVANPRYVHNSDKVDLFSLLVYQRWKPRMDSKRIAEGSDRRRIADGEQMDGKRIAAGQIC